jgi:predicted metalloendopeptidase
VKEVQSAFQRELMILPWLNDDTREWAIEKAASIHGNIGYGEWVRDAKKMDQFYGDVSLQLLCHLLVVEGSLMNGLSFE